MVIVFLNTMQFEAEKFESRTMPTPDMKGKEMIYWIVVRTSDKRLATEIQRFLEGAPKLIELKVPSAFVAVKTELESYRIPTGAIKKSEEIAPSGSIVKKKLTDLESSQQSGQEFGISGSEPVEPFTIEIVLRRNVQEEARQSQSPYG